MRYRVFFLQKTSILHARWPVVGEIDEVAVKASNYFMDAIHNFRIYLKNHCAVKKAKKGEAPKQEPKPNKAVIWVAKEYPRWQHIILTTLKELNGVSIKFCSFFNLFLKRTRLFTQMYEAL